MTPDDRTPTVDHVLDELSARLNHEVRAVVSRLITAAAEQQREATAAARQAALDEAAEVTRRQIEDLEARGREETARAVAQAQVEERDRLSAQIRQQVEADTEQRLQHAAATAQATLTQALQAAEEQKTTALAALEADISERIRTSVADARGLEREAEMAAFTRLLESVRGLDGATTLSEVLDVLAQSAGREAARVAVFVLRNGRLNGWKLLGFGAHDAQPKAIDLGLNEGGVVGLAAGSAKAVSTRDTQGPGGPEFAHLPQDRMGFAVPVIVGGRVVAVVYADGVADDEQEHAVPSEWPEVIEILARHAARCLEALTVQRAAAAPSPRFWVPVSGRQNVQTRGSQSSAALNPAAPGADSSSRIMV